MNRVLIGVRPVANRQTDFARRGLWIAGVAGLSASIAWASAPTSPSTTGASEAAAGSELPLFAETSTYEDALVTTTEYAGVLDTKSGSTLTAVRYSGTSGGQGVAPLYSQRAYAPGGGGLGSGEVRDLDLFNMTLNAGGVDLSFPTQGYGVTIGRSYNGIQSTASDGYQGSNWFQNSRPEVMRGSANGGTNNILYLVLGAGQMMEFRAVADSSTTVFVGVNGTQAIATHVPNANNSIPGVYEVRDLNGYVWTFFDFDTESQGAAGQLWKVQDEDGTGDTAYVGVSSSMSDGLAGFEHSGGVRTARINTFVDSSDRKFSYTYATVGGKTRLTEVTAQIKTGGTWASSPSGVTTVGEVDYTYYDGTNYTANGLAGDLKTVTVSMPLSSGDDLVRTTYYRYAVASGQEHLIRLIIGPEGYRRYTGGSIETETDATLTPYSTHKITYDSGAKTVASIIFNGECGCGGGSANGEHFVSRELNSTYFSGSANAYDGDGDWGSADWYSRTTVTRPDGNVVAVYFDEVGQMMGRVQSDTGSFTSGSPQLWKSKLIRDAYGRMVKQVPPEALEGNYVHAAASFDFDLGGDSVVREMVYEDTGAFVTATANVKVKEGSATAVDLTETPVFETTQSVKKAEQVVGSDTYVAQLTRVMPNEVARYVTPSVSQDTTISRTYWSSTVGNPQYWAVKSTTTTLPALDSGDTSGPSTVTMVSYSDEKGRTVFSRDGVGVYSFTLYNTLGQVVKTIRDPNTSDSDATAAATIFGISLSSGGLNYTTEYTYDDQGRLTSTELPSGRVTATFYTQLADGRMVTVSVPKATSLGASGGEGPVSYTVMNLAGKVEAQATIALTSGSTGTGMVGWIDTGSTDVISAVKIGTVAHLTVNTYDETSAHLLSTKVFHTIPASLGAATSGQYDETTFAYDDMGRIIRTVDPTGTISRTVFDDLGRPIQSWVGTNDTGDAGSSMSGTNNMVKVATTVYDAGGVGNGKVTERRAHVDSSSGNDRVTTMVYDLRDRLAAQHNPVAPHSAMAYDNLDRVIASAQYSSTTGLGSTSTLPTVKPEELTATNNANRTALSTTVYNTRGQVRESARHEVNQSTGASSDSVVTLSWFDANGRAIKTSGPQLAKTLYDTLGRTTHQFVLASTDDSAYSDASTVSGDKVLEERQTLYDNSANTGLVLMTASIQRHPGDTSTTGALDAVGDAVNVVNVSSGSMKGRVSITSYYYDNLDRNSATVSLGTNGGSTYTRSSDSSVGSRSDTRLISSNDYNPDGTLKDTTDPMGRVARTLYDAARRRTKTLNNFTDTTPGGGTLGDQDQVIEYGYTNGLMTTMTAKMPSSGDDQTTTYTYGVTTGGGSTLASNRLLQKVTYPDSSGSSDVVAYTYNRLGQQVTVTDQAGNVITTSYDAGGRESARVATTVVTGFDATVRRIELAYLSRGMIDTVTQYNATSSGTVLDQVRYAYDGWGNQTHVYQDVDSTMNSSGVSSGGRDAFDYEIAWAKHTPAAGGGGSTLRRTGVNAKAGTTPFEEVSFTYASGLDADSSRVSAITAEVNNSGTAVTVATYDYLGMGTLVGTTLNQPGLSTTVFDNSSGVTYPDLDTFGRPTRWDWLRVNPIYDTTIAYDRNSNPTSTTDNYTVRVEAGGNKHLFDVVYAIDGLNRVVKADEGNIVSGAIESGYRTRLEEWNSLSLTGNWGNRKLDVDGDGSFTGEDDREELSAYNTFNKANEWTTRRENKGSGTDYNGWADTYDAVGNLTRQVQTRARTGLGTAVGGRGFKYDVFGRVVQIGTDLGSGLVSNSGTVYRYNGLNQRIMWVRDEDSDDAPENSERVYVMYDDRWRMVGTFLDDDSTPKEAWVYHHAGMKGTGSSSYIDSVVLRDRDANSSGWLGSSDGTLEQRHYYCQNWRADVVVLALNSGTPAEFVRYSSYGEPTVYALADVNRDGVINGDDYDDYFDVLGETYSGLAVPLDVNGDGNVDSLDVDEMASSEGLNSNYTSRGNVGTVYSENRKGYAGYEWDTNERVYHVRHRVYLPENGRWTRRDPMGYVDGGSLYQYVQSRAITTIDPSGTMPICCLIYFGFTGWSLYDDFIGCAREEDPVNAVICILQQFVDLDALVELRICVAQAVRESTIDERVKAVLNCLRDHWRPILQDSALICCITPVLVLALIGGGVVTVPASVSMMVPMPLHPIEDTKAFVPVYATTHLLEGVAWSQL
jgi:RHS repeat-associated protein